MKRRIMLGLMTTTTAMTAGTAFAQTEPTTTGPQATTQEETRPTSPTEDGSKAESQEIVVTASKRKQLLRDVPSAISVVDSETIENLGIEDFRDYSSLVPGLSQRDFGTPGTGAIILRGLNTGAQQTTNTSAFYIDEAPFTANGFVSFAAQTIPEPELADVDRIEVLKGPQGTLYGANNLGGLIRVITKKPDTNDMFGNARIEGMDVDGGGMGYSARGSLNVPLITDKLAARAVAFYRGSPGFTDNVGTGNKNANHARSVGGRLALRATPTADLTVDVSGLVQDIRARGFAFQQNVTDTLTPVFGRNKYRHFDDLTTRIKYRLLNGVADYDIGPGSIIASLSHARAKPEFVYEVSEVFIPLLGGLVPPEGGVFLEQAPDMKKLSAEARFVSERFGPAEFLVGVFYTDESVKARTDLLLFESAGQPLPAPFTFLLRNPTVSDYREIAGFGNLTFYLTDQLDVTGGIRYAANDQKVQAPGPGASNFFAPVPPREFGFDDTATTYLATVRWRPTNTLSTYLRAASGYRPGGPQRLIIPVPGAQEVIEPDTVWNYEAGVRGSFLRRALNISASVFHIDWRNIQLNTLVGGRTLEANGGKAKVDGFEVELQAVPTDRLTIAASLGHTNARLTQIDPSAGATIGASKGDKLPLTPSWTAALTAEHTLPISSGLDGRLGATLRHQSRMHSSFPAALNTDIRLPAITTVDLRAGVEWDRYRLQFRAENVFDEIGYVSVETIRLFPGQVVPSVASVIRPRTFVISLGADF